MEKISLKSVFFSKPFIYITYFIILLSTCNINIGAVTTATEIFSFMLSFIVIGGYILEKKYSKFSFILLIFMIAGIVVSILGEKSSLKLFIKSYYKIIAISLMTELGIRTECKKTLGILSRVLFILVLVNFYTIIRYQIGKPIFGYNLNNWFFKYDNIHILFFLPAIIVSMISLKLQKENKIMNFVLISMITYQVYYCFSANTVVVYTLLLIYLLFYKVIDGFKVFSPKNYFYIFFIIFIGIVIFRVQDILSWLIVDILGKDLTFTGRTIIWNEIMEYIKIKPILGYGFETTDIISAKLGSRAFTHAHNTLLDLMYKCGIVLAGIFVYLLNIVIKQLEKHKNDKISKHVAFAMLCMFIMMNFEAREDRIGLYIILVLGYNIKYIINCMNERSIEEERLKYDKKNNEENNIPKYI